VEPPPATRCCQVGLRQCFPCRCAGRGPRGYRPTAFEARAQSRKKKLGGPSPVALGRLKSATGQGTSGVAQQRAPHRLLNERETVEHDAGHGDEDQADHDRFTICDPRYNSQSNLGRGKPSGAALLDSPDTWRPASRRRSDDPSRSLSRAALHPVPLGSLLVGARLWRRGRRGRPHRCRARSRRRGFGFFSGGVTPGRARGPPPLYRVRPCAASGIRFECARRKVPTVALDSQAGYRHMHRGSPAQSGGACHPGSTNGKRGCRGERPPWPSTSEKPPYRPTWPNW